MKANISNTINTVKQLFSEGQKLMIVMIGLPGSGKSTLISAMREAGISFTVASTDDIIDAYTAEHNLTYSEAHRKINWKDAQVNFKMIIRQSVDEGNSCVIDRTNMSEKSRRGYFDTVRNRGYTTIALNLQCDDHELQKRIDKRANATGKYIPSRVIKEMAERYNAPSTKEGFNLIIDVLTQDH